MARYFFHVRRDAALFEDTHGGEFPDIVAAWSWAISDAQTLIRDGQVDGLLDHHWIDICDQRGATVASLPFGRVLAKLN